jgi:hypothetical protein
MNIPGQAGALETASPPLPLALHYLMTAFGKDNDTTVPNGHHLLGRAMSVLYDHALLGPQEIASATAVSLPNSDLDKQVERIRITLQPFTLEEISKLWMGFATQYRLSVAYEVSVALIESAQPARTPLPVLTRGANDRGILSQANLNPPHPTLNAVQYPNSQTNARLGDQLILTGSNLDGANIGIVFNHSLWTDSVEIPPDAGSTPTQLKVTIPNSPALWPAGFYTVAGMVQRPGETYRRATNLLSFALAPSMTITPPSAAGPSITYTATCSPEVRPEQRASLLLGDQEVLADSHKTQTPTLTFAAQNLVAGTYFVRLRVDGVDSLLVNRAVTPPVFDPTQKVTIT